VVSKHLWTEYHSSDDTRSDDHGNSHNAASDSYGVYRADHNHADEQSATCTFGSEYAHVFRRYPQLPQLCYGKRFHPCPDHRI
jgi:hypothetical protein